MMVPICDRCQGPGNLTLVLGHELCNGCVSAVKAWLSLPALAPSTPRQRHRALLVQAATACKASGYVSAESVATVNGWTPRVAYHRLRYLARKGWLRDRGKGVFQIEDVSDQAAE